MTSSKADCTFGGRPVDLVREEEVAEHRAQLGVERAVAGAEHARPHEVGRDEIRCELNSRERSPEHTCGRLDGQRLCETRHAFDQKMALSEQTDEHPLEHGVLAGDDAANLEERLLETLLCLGGRRDGPFVGFGHRSLLRSVV